MEHIKDMVVPLEGGIEDLKGTYETRSVLVKPVVKNGNFEVSMTADNVRITLFRTGKKRDKGKVASIEDSRFLTRDRVPMAY